MYVFKTRRGITVDFFTVERAKIGSRVATNDDT